MKGDYPCFKGSYSHDELLEFFTLNEAELAFVNQFKTDVNRYSVAILLKSLPYLGYFPEHPTAVSESIRSFMGFQLNMLFDYSNEYPREGGTKDYHLAAVREFTGYRSPTDADRDELEQWLQSEAAYSAPTHEELLEAAYQRLRQLKIALPPENRMQRTVSAALNNFFNRLDELVFERLPERSQRTIDSLIAVDENFSFSPFDSLKDEPDKASIKALLKELKKLQTLRLALIDRNHLNGVPWKVVKLLARRAKNETATEMREHPERIRYTLMSCFIYFRSLQVTDDIVKMFLDLLHRISVRAKTELELQLLKRVNGKMGILHQLSATTLNFPDAIIREAVYPIVSREKLETLVKEFELWGPRQKRKHRTIMKEKYTRHYRRMIGPIIESIVFRSSNQFQPVIEALEIIKRTLKLKGNYFHDPVPIAGIVTHNWEPLVFEEVREDRLVVKKYYELCVLQKLERALKCKEVWAEGALGYRNPDEDMPKDWEDPQRRSYYYSVLNQPLDAKLFIGPLQKQLADALRSFDAALPKCEHVRIKDGKFSLSKLQARPESTNINVIKDAIFSEYGMIDLLDLFATADRITNFTGHLVHSGRKEVRTREQLRPLIILNIFAEGTNVGVKRVARANRLYDYSDLLYVRKTYFSPEALRNAITAVTNRILQLRNPEIWGEGNACASDGKAFGSWDQNLLSEWRTRHKGYGVVVYWHVENGAICIYSQLKNFSSSEVAAMIEGLIRHNSEAQIDRNYVDSHGQSEVAFAFVKLLNRFRLMPRLKRIKDQCLYLPGPASASAYPNLAGIFARPVMWNLMEQQYDEMIKATTAVTEGTATTEAVMRRYNSYNQTHPTFKALKELGKVEKTIYLCEYLASRDMQYEVNTGLNVVENWNATNQFLHYAKEGEFASNDRESNLVATLCLHLLQNCMILVNTLIIEKVLEKKGMVKSARTEDLRGISPLIHGHINPFGRFELDLEKPMIIEVA